MVGYLNYTASTGRFLAVDKSAPGNPAVLDTDGGMLYTPPANVFSGSIAIPARSASSSGINGLQNILDLTAEYYIGSLNVASANIVRGSIRYDGVSDNNLWRQAYGSHRKEWDAISFTAVPQTDLVGKYYSAVMQDFTPLVNNLGHVVMRERTVIRARDPGSPPSITKALTAFTLQYRLHADFWWGNPEIIPAPDAELRGVANFSLEPVANFSVNAGYGYPGRRLVAIIYGSSSLAPTSITIGGVTATTHDSIATASTRITVASVMLDNNVGGANADSVSVTVTYAGSNIRTAVAIHAVRSLTGASPTMVKASSATSALALALTVPSNAVAITASVCNGGSSAACTWTNATEELDYFNSADPTKSRSSAVVAPGLGSQNVTATWSTSVSEHAAIAAVFG